MKRLCFLAVALFTVTGAGCGAQPSHDEVVRKLQSVCPGSELLEIEYKKNYVEVDYQCSGKNYELALTHEMEVLYTENVPDIPRIIRAKIDKKLAKNYSDWVEDEYTLIDLGDTAFYKFEMLKAGVEQNVYFSLSGKYFDSEGLAIVRDKEVGELAKSDGYSSALYDFARPDRTIDLPNVLVEVSGIFAVDNNELWAVQDEVGAVFKVDAKTGKVKEVLRFTDVGDFEDLEVADDEVYVLRSDGALFRFGLDFSGDHANHQMLPVGCLDLEGLHYDRAEETWCVACKESTVGGKHALRTIYQFADNDFSEPTEEWVISETAIQKMLQQQFPEGNWKNREFNPSALATHPQNGDRYVLSAKDRTLAIYSEGDLKQVFPLAEAIYYKPEGLDFAADGTLYISSEGQKKGRKPGQVFVFSMKNKP